YVIKIHARDHGARHVRSAQKRNHLPLESCETAASMAGSPEAPRRKEQVEVRHPLKRAVEPCQCESRFQQRKIERRAVVCDDKLESLDELGECMQHGRLFIEVPDEVLNHMKLVAGKVAKADEERTHA